MSAPVFAIVVAYQPDAAALAAQFAALAPQVARVLLVDNGSSGAARQWLDDQAAAGRLELLRPAGNVGVAGGQNLGIAAARRLGAGQVLFLDQDSVPAADMLAQLLAAQARLSAAGVRIGLLAPVFHCPQSGVRGRFLVRQGDSFASCQCAAEETRAVDIAIASGSLVALAVLDEVGPMDENLFIDAVDTEWCLRARALGFAIFAVGAARLAHKLGEGSRRVLLPSGWRQVPVHAPLRSYTIARNNLLLCRLAHVPPAWRRYVAAMLCRRLGFCLIFGPCRLAHVAALWRGVRDGLAGRGGAPTGVPSGAK